MTRETLRLLDLPSDLVDEILSCVPPTSRCQLQSTCKRWRALFKDPKFIKKQVDKAANKCLVLMFIDYRVSSVNLHEIHRNIVDPTMVFKGGLSLTDLHHTEQVCISEVFHCDGLLLCTTRCYRLVVWNPCNGQTRPIQPESRYKMHCRVALGYENNISCRRYKILSCCGNHGPLVRFEIYEFISDSWRVLDYVLTNSFILQNGVSMKGNTYWLFSDNDVKSISLLSFDFTTEEFICMSLPFESPSVDTITLSVVREEQLSVLHQTYGTLEMEIWVTNNDKNDHTNVLSWEKFLAVDLSTHHCLFSSSMSFFIDKEKKVAVCCDERYEDKTIRDIVCIVGEDIEYTEISLGDTDRLRWPFIFNYAPSSAHIQQG